MIELGGKTRNLRYDFNAFVALEEALNISIAEIGALLTGSVKLRDLRAILWAGLIHEDRALTQEDVGKAIGGMQDMAALGVAVRAALEAAFPAPEKKAEPALSIPKNRRSPRRV